MLDEKPEEWEEWGTQERLNYLKHGTPHAKVHPKDEFEQFFIGGEIQRPGCTVLDL